MTPHRGDYDDAKRRLRDLSGRRWVAIRSGKNRHDKRAQAAKIRRGIRRNNRLIASKNREAGR